MMLAMLLVGSAGSPTPPTTVKYFETDDRTDDGWTHYGTSEVAYGMWRTDYGGSSSVLSKVYGSPLANAVLKLRMEAGSGVRRNHRIASVFLNSDPHNKGVRVHINQVDDSYPIGHTHYEIWSNGTKIWESVVETSTSQTSEGEISIVKTGSSWMVTTIAGSHTFTNTENVDCYHASIEGSASFQCGVNELEYANP